MTIFLFPQPSQQYEQSRFNGDSIDSSEKMNIKKLVGHMKTSVVLSDNELELLSNMDMDNVADLVGEDFMEQLKEIKENSGR